MDVCFQELCDVLNKNPQDFNHLVERYEALQKIVKIAEHDNSRIGWAVFSACQMGEGEISPGQAVSLTFGGPRDVSSAPKLGGDN